MSTWPMFYKHIIHVYYHGISKSICILKKCNNYMTRFPFVIQEKNNKKKCSNTSPWHPKIKKIQCMYYMIVEGLEKQIFILFVR